MIKKSLLLLSAFILALNIAACAGTPGDDSDSSESSSVSEVVEPGDTIGSKYLAVFANSDTTDAESAVKELIDSNIFEATLMEREITDGYLPGFDGEISGYTKAVNFSAMISTIPFTGYVFESDDPEALLKELEEAANPRWNVCTEADETVSYIRDNMVFFLMCPSE